MSATSTTSTYGDPLFRAKDTVNWWAGRTLYAIDELVLQEAQ